MHVVEDGDHGRVYSIGAVTEAAPLTVSGPTLTLRYATPDDAPRLLELGSDPLVTRYFSWGPYARVEEPLAYIKELAGKRERGRDARVPDRPPRARADRRHGAVRAVARATAARPSGRGSGATYWGTGSNLESKALVAALAFETLGMGRLTAWANTRNGRSQAALERVGFSREGVLRGWHRHGDTVHDVVVFGLVRAEWERSALREVPAEVSGTAPALFVLGNPKKG